MQRTHDYIEQAEEMSGWRDVHGQDSYAQLWLFNYRVKLGISVQ